MKLTPEERERFQRAPTNNLEAYDFYLRGRENFRRAFYEVKKEANVQARQAYEKAIVLDPQYAGAYAEQGLTYFIDWFYQWGPDVAQSLENAFELAQRAVALDDTLASPHRILGVIYVWKKQYDQAIKEGKRALALDPNDAENHWTLGDILRYAGRPPEENLKLIQQALRLNPTYSPEYLTALGAAYRVAGQCEDALPPLKRVLTLTPNFAPAHLNLAACYAELNVLNEAQAEMTEFLRLRPKASLEAFRQYLPYKDPAILERYVVALRRAGLK